MCTFKSLTFETGISTKEQVELLDAICNLGIGDTLDLASFPRNSSKPITLSGEVSASDGEYLEGQIIFTSQIVSIKRIEGDAYIALTKSGRGYQFSINRRFGRPTLNNWSFEVEDNAIFADFAICQHDSFRLDPPVAIQGETSEVPGFQNGTPLAQIDIVEFDKTDIENAIVARTQTGVEFILPLEQRIGFISANFLQDWHLMFEYPPDDNEAANKRLIQFINEFYEFSSRKELLPKGEYKRTSLQVPPEFGIGIESKKFYSDRIKYFLRIQYLGRSAFYAVKDESAGQLLRYDINDADRDQRKLFRGAAAVEAKMANIKARRTMRRVQLSDLRI